MKVLIITFLLFTTSLLFSQTVVKKDSIIITIKLKIEKRGIFLKDSFFECGDVNIRFHKDSTYYYANHQYLKLKTKKK